ncbi:hypothetical protein WAI453_000115 [Rhynchosporium graminicola]
MSRLRDIAQDKGRKREAASWYAKCYVLNVETLGPGHKYSMSRCTDLGFCYSRQGLFDEAISHFEMAISKIERVRKENDDSLNLSVGKIRSWITTVKTDKCRATGFGYADQGCFDEATTHFEQAVSELRLHVGEENSPANKIERRIRRWIATVGTDKCKAIAFSYADQGSFDEAIPYLE